MYCEIVLQVLVALFKLIFARLSFGQFVTFLNPTPIFPKIGYIFQGSVWTEVEVDNEYAKKLGLMHNIRLGHLFSNRYSRTMDIWLLIPKLNVKRLFAS